MDDEMKSEFQLLVKALDQLLAKQEKFSVLITVLAQDEAAEVLSVKQMMINEEKLEGEVKDLGKLIK
jgi:hypothetical protein